MQALMHRLQARHERHYKGNRFHLMADIIIALTIICLIGSVIWLFLWRPTSVAIDITQITPKVMSGQVAEFEINYKNKKPWAMTTADITLKLPNNFVLQSVVPTENFDKSSNTFRLGNVESGAIGKIKIKGLVYGQIDERQTIGLVLDYTTHADTLMGQILSSLSYNIETSSLQTEVILPNNLYQGIMTNGSIVVTNIGINDLQNIKINLESSELELLDSGDLVDGQIKLPELKVGESRDFKVNILPLKLGQAKLINNNYLVTKYKDLLQSSKQSDLNILKPNVKLEAQIKSNIITNIEPFNLKLSLLSSDKNLNRLEVKLAVDNENVQINRLESKNTNYRIVNNALVFISPKDKDKLEADILVYLNKKTDQAKLKTNLIATVESEAAQKSESYNIQISELKFASEIKSKVYAYYYSANGDQLGVGPLPPVIDIPTEYWLNFSIDNQGAILNDINLSADLGERALWTDKQMLSSGELKYGAVTKQLVWHLDKIQQPVKVDFSINLVATKNDLGKVVDLLKNLKLSYKDEFTGQIISRNLANITTDLNEDVLARGKAKIVK